MSILSMMGTSAMGARLKIAKPSITAPTNGETDVDPDTTIYSSPFAVTGGTTTHQSSDWELATDPNFTNIVASSYNDTTNKTSWKPNAA